VTKEGYKTNEQIITSKVSTEVGEAATTQVRSITFNDQNAIATLQQLRTAYKDADIFLSGELAIDFPEDIKIPIEPNQRVTAQVVGSSLKFSYCGLDRAIAFLKDQFAVGTLEVKVVQLRS
jgi:inner membrane protein